MALSRRHVGDGKAIRGMIKPMDTDMRYGRRWIVRGEDRKPVLYSRIGSPNRSHNISQIPTKLPYTKRAYQEVYRKRWPLYHNCDVEFFSEFADRPHEERTLIETAATVPFFGLYSTFWRSREKSPCPGPSGLSFIPTVPAYFKTMPFEGKIRGDEFWNGMRIRSNVAARGKSSGCWNWSPPEGGLKIYYRPPFPEAVHPPPKKNE
ncbi:hypothetical protein FOZ61_004183 [Perkinsus olseni]|uniref:Uncharacterized protein n=1 Tax=Perkinsus olseni TaxID=32597 RepID=A0A7J6ME31_PEROL|nr:hypothetical protein FOZ61_004183 [Perkinsus olseni]KAF4674888.1 hypothetical protein FOL46_003629 [Perkinsus olseni]